MAKDQVYTSDKSTTANVLGLEKEDFKKKYLAPKRSISDNEIPFPYGNTP
jgi:hypothetical protein